MSLWWDTNWPAGERCTLVFSRTLGAAIELDFRKEPGVHFRASSLRGVSAGVPDGRELLIEFGGGPTPGTVHLEVLGASSGRAAERESITMDVRVSRVEHRSAGEEPGVGEFTERLISEEMRGEDGLLDIRRRLTCQHQVHSGHVVTEEFYRGKNLACTYEEVGFSHAGR